MDLPILVTVIAYKLDTRLGLLAAWELFGCQAPKQIPGTETTGTMRGRH